VLPLRQWSMLYAGRRLHGLQECVILRKADCLWRIHHMALPCMLLELASMSILLLWHG
jgi:hypothetical protein